MRRSSSQKLTRRHLHITSRCMAAFLGITVLSVRSAGGSGALLTRTCKAGPWRLVTRCIPPAVVRLGECLDARVPHGSEYTTEKHKPSPPASANAWHAGTYAEGLLVGTNEQTIPVVHELPSLSTCQQAQSLAPAQRHFRSKSLRCGDGCCLVTASRKASSSSALFCQAPCCSKTSRASPADCRAWEKLRNSAFPECAGTLVICPNAVKVTAPSGRCSELSRHTCRQKVL